MTEATKSQCVARVKNSGYTGGFQCLRRGTVVLGDGRTMCKQHASAILVDAQAMRRRAIQAEALAQSATPPRVDMHLGKLAEIGSCYECEALGVLVTRIGDARFCKNCLRIALDAFRKDR